MSIQHKIGEKDDAARLSNFFSFDVKFLFLTKDTLKNNTK